MKHRFAGLVSCTAWHAALVAIVITLPSGASLAQGTRAQRLACTGDVWRLCSAAVPSVDRIVACLQREKARLSPGCQAVFNDPQVQTAINRPPAAAPDKAAAEARPQQAAGTTAAPSGVDSTAAERPNIVSRSLPPASSKEVALPPAPPKEVALPPAPPKEVASAPTPALSGAGRTPTAPTAPTARVAARDVESMTRHSLRHGRQRREAYRQSYRRTVSRHRYDEIIAEIAPLIVMAMGDGQRGAGFDNQSMMGGSPLSGYGGYGGRGDVDVGQIIGMVRSMGFDPGRFMGGDGGYWR